MTPPGLPKWARPAFVGALALLVYLPSLWNTFALDDVSAVAQDERIRDLGNVPELLLAPYLTYMPRERSPYRPVTTVSYAVSWAMGGGHPAAFHVVNVTLHAGATLLFLSLLTALGASAVPATWAAALFAIHPVHVEAVAGVVGRADVLSTLFVLLALRLHLSSTLRPGLRIALVAYCYLLALGSKESAVVLPVLLVVVEAIRRSGVHPKALIATWPTLAALSAALAIFLVARTSVLGSLLHLDVAAYIAVLPTGVRVTTAIANFSEVARLLVVPWDLSPEYGPGTIVPVHVGQGRFWVGFGVLAGSVTLVGVGLRDWSAAGSRWLVGGVLWVATSFALLSNLLVPMPMWLAERTLYLASAGIALMVVAGLEHSAKRLSPPRLTSVLLAVVVTVGGLHTAQRSRVWHSDDTLFADLVERHPESFRAQSWIGSRLVDAGQVERGLVWLGQAVSQNPNSALLTLDYVRALLLAGRSVEAEELVRPVPPHLHPSSSVFLAQSLIFQGRQVEAADVVRRGLEYFPSETRLLDQARQLGIGG
ncbi:MAG: tetratricopeptide repeat protein [Gemmatimonadetes bacterium]|nr:tetratricopeptide repeat protein [Gemmatimonadota bacterium]MDA1102891.1 tetratricopeptide repeat protein [Gemmatimonadota bacterium]